MTVDVTQRDIDFGVIGDCELCPVARAIDRVLAPGVEAIVEPSFVVVGLADDLGRSGGTTLTLPFDAWTFILDFDAEKDVGPFAFDLDIPAEFLKERAAP